MDERAEGEAVAPGGRHVGDADPLVAVGGSPRPHLQGLGAAVLHDGCIYDVHAYIKWSSVKLTFGLRFGRLRQYFSDETDNNIVFFGVRNSAVRGGT